MFRPEQKVSIGLIVGIGAAASAALAAFYVLYKRDEEGFDLDPRLEPMLAETQSRISYQPAKFTKIHKNIPKDAVGAVIGRGGESIRLIQKRTNTKINFANDNPNDNSDRTLTIKGSPSGVLAADELIDTIIQQSLACILHKIYIGPSEVGLVIGKNGSSIKSISDESGAKVSIPRNYRGAKGQDNVPIEIRGEPASVQTAINMINDRLKLSKTAKNSTFNSSMSNGNGYSLDLTNFRPVHVNIATLGSDDFAKLRSNFDSGFVDIYVSRVESPSKFIVHHCGTELDRLMHDMTDFYEKIENKEKARLTEMEVGDIVAAPIFGDENWLRAKIVKIGDKVENSDGVEVTVYYLDFGGEATLSAKYLCSLHDDFLYKMPFQAIECSLFGVSPISGSEWSAEAADYFKRITHASMWMKMFAKTVEVINTEVKPREHYVIELIDMKSDTDLDIAQSLVDQGYAFSTKTG